jgi:lipid-binding SYLF domain-containing protein
MFDTEQTRSTIKRNVLGLWRFSLALRNLTIAIQAGLSRDIETYEHGEFIMKWKYPLAAIGLVTLSLFVTSTAFADSKDEIDASVGKALKQFYALNPKNEELANKAEGILIFPSITKGGVGVAGEYGEGALQVKGMTVDYYNIMSASIGLTLGVATRAEIVMFMTQESLDKFKNSDGWKIGVDAGVAIVSMGAGGQYDTKTLQQPILGFVFGEKGLIGDLSLEGSKVSKMQK